jgi:hypothetical protein
LSVLTYPRSTASSSSNSSTFRPVASTASRMPLLTARSTARSAGSGRCFSTIETATSKGKPGIATPACAARSRFRLRARVSTPRDASATIKADAACTARVVARASRASLCVPRPRSEIREKRVVVVRFVEVTFRAIFFNLDASSASAECLRRRVARRHA